MFFQSQVFKHAETGAQAKVYLPEPGQPASYSRKQTVAEIQLDGRTRVVLTGVLDMALRFQSDAIERANLGQDCTAFALACLSSDPQNGVVYGGSAGRRVRAVGADYRSPAQALEPPTEPGDIAFISSSLPSTEIPWHQGHLMVRASVDEAENLYFSKLSTEGPVAAHSFNAALQLYPGTKATGVIRGLETL